MNARNPKSKPSQLRGDTSPEVLPELVAVAKESRDDRPVLPSRHSGGPHEEPPVTFRVTFLTLVSQIVPGTPFNWSPYLGSDGHVLHRERHPAGIEGKPRYSDGLAAPGTERADRRAPRLRRREYHGKVPVGASVPAHSPVDGVVGDAGLLVHLRFRVAGGWCVT